MHLSSISIALESLEIKLDFESQFAQQPVIKIMRCHHHTTDAVTAQNSPQTASSWTTNTFLGSFSQMEVAFVPIWILITWVFIKALHYFMRLQEAIAILLSVYMHWILAFGDCFTDLALIMVFVYKKNVPDFQSVDGSARWQTSFNFNHTPHASTLPSTGHCRPTVQLLLCLP